MANQEYGGFGNSATLIVNQWMHNDYLASNYIHGHAKYYIKIHPENERNRVRVLAQDLKSYLRIEREHLMPSIPRPGSSIIQDLITDLIESRINWERIAERFLEEAQNSLI